MVTLNMTDLLDDYPTRLVLPLETLERAGTPATRLNPVFDLLDDQWVLKADLASTVRQAELGRVECSLNHQRDRIIDAFDMLITGF